MTPLIPYFNADKIQIFGGITLKTPGVLLLTGLIAGSVAAVLKARRDGLRIELILGFLPWLFVGLLVGSHLGEVLFYKPELLREQPMILLKIWDGQSSLGAFILSAILGMWYFKRQELTMRNRMESELNPWSYADAMLYGSTLGWFFGRMGCFAVHDHPGVETHFWFAVYGICPSAMKDVACHDLGLYEGVLSLIFFFLIMVLDRKRRFPGYFVAVLTVAYGVSRFFLDELRHPLMDVRYFGLTPAQYGCMVLISLGIWIFMRHRHTKVECINHANHVDLARRGKQSADDR